MKKRSKTSVCCGVLLPDAVSWDCIAGVDNPVVCLAFLPSFIVVAQRRRLSSIGRELTTSMNYGNARKSVLRGFGCLVVDKSF